MVRKERLELSRLTALEPKSSASTNSATLAGCIYKAFTSVNYISDKRLINQGTYCISSLPSSRSASCDYYYKYYVKLLVILDEVD